MHCQNWIKLCLGCQVTDQFCLLLHFYTSCKDSSSSVGPLEVSVQGRRLDSTALHRHHCTTSSNICASLCLALSLSPSSAIKAVPINRLYSESDGLFKQQVSISTANNQCWCKQNCLAFDGLKLSRRFYITMY